MESYGTKNIYVCMPCPKKITRDLRLVFLMIYSACTLNKCRYTLLPNSEQFNFSFSLLSVAFWSLYNAFKRQMRWLPSFFWKSYSQFVLVYTVKSLRIINKAKSDIFLDLPCVSHYPWMLAMGSQVSLALQNPACTYIC